jgi:hypothetical protein
MSKLGVPRPEWMPPGQRNSISGYRNPVTVTETQNSKDGAWVHNKKSMMMFSIKI